MVLHNSTQWWAQLPELWQHGFCPRIYIYMDVCHVVYTVAHSGGHSSQNSSNMDSAPGYTYIWMCAMWYTQWNTVLGTAPRTLATWILPQDILYTVQGCVPCGIHSRTQRWVQLPELWQHGFCPRIYMDVSHVVYTVAHSGGNSCQNSGNMNSVPDIHI